ncbi:MAG: hypothetical protein DMF85_08625 [Acidobacteria bacterium]|nr:MAG: hypothetical protein DMF85_08625 [Acidobacteriota bacterium]
MLLLWLIAGAALVGGWSAWARARRLARKLDALNQSYWELRYDFTRLRSQVARLDPGEPEEPSPPPAPSPTVAFVPLASIKKGHGSGT